MVGVGVGVGGTGGRGAWFDQFAVAKEHKNFHEKPSQTQLVSLIGLSFAHFSLIFNYG